MEDLNSKVGFVTGGAGGIGYGIAQAMVAEGMKVMLADIEVWLNSGFGVCHETCKNRKSFTRRSNSYWGSRH
jgi:NAD(P)-dependent dehydrogenase (short-subunit alcohol dehydrogenase family)